MNINQRGKTTSTATSIVAYTKKHLSSWLGTALLLIILLWGVNAWRTRDVPNVAPGFTAPMLDGSTLSLSQLRQQHPDRAIALIFWAEWCPICRTEEHSINRLIRDKNLLIVPIATQSGSANEVRRILSERGHDWNMLLDEQGTLLNAFGLVAVPSLLVIDSDGQIRHIQTGYTSELGMRVRIWLSQF